MERRRPVGGGVPSSPTVGASGRMPLHPLLSALLTRREAPTPSGDYPLYVRPYFHLDPWSVLARPGYLGREQPGSFPSSRATPGRGIGMRRRESAAQRFPAPRRRLPVDRAKAIPFQTPTVGPTIGTSEPRGMTEMNDEFKGLRGVRVSRIVGRAGALSSVEPSYEFGLQGTELGLDRVQNPEAVREVDPLQVHRGA